MNQVNPPARSREEIPNPRESLGYLEYRCLGSLSRELRVLVLGDKVLESFIPKAEYKKWFGLLCHLCNKKDGL